MREKRGTQKRERDGEVKEDRKDEKKKIEFFNFYYSVL